MRGSAGRFGRVFVAAVKVSAIVTAIATAVAVVMAAATAVFVVFAVWWWSSSWSMDEDELAWCE